LTVTEDDVEKLMKRKVATAVTETAVFACCQVLSQDAAHMPITLKQIDNETYIDAIDHPLYEILHDLWPRAGRKAG